MSFDPNTKEFNPEPRVKGIQLRNHLCSGTGCPNNIYSPSQTVMGLRFITPTTKEPGQVYLN